MDPIKPDMQNGEPMNTEVRAIEEDPARLFVSGENRKIT